MQNVPVKRPTNKCKEVCKQAAKDVIKEKCEDQSREICENIIVVIPVKKTKEVCELKPEKSCKVEVVKRIRLVPRKVCTELKEPARESKLIRLKLPDEARTINLNNTNSVK